MSYRSRAACLLIAAALLVACSRGSTTAPATEPEFQNMGVCIRLNDPKYAITRTEVADFDIVDLKKGDALVARIYVGLNPGLDHELISDIRIRRSAYSARSPIALGKSGEFLGVPANDADAYFHVMFDRADAAERRRVLRSIGFCQERRSVPG